MFKDAEMHADPVASLADMHGAECGLISLPFYFFLLISKRSRLDHEKGLHPEERGTPRLISCKGSKMQQFANTHRSRSFPPDSFSYVDIATRT